jgi:hypothetical protein
VAELFCVVGEGYLTIVQLPYYCVGLADPVPETAAQGLDSHKRLELPQDDLAAVTELRRRRFTIA